MKYLLLILTFIVASACHESKKKKFLPRPEEHARTTVIFTWGDPLSNQHFITNMDRIIKDTTAMIPVDSSTVKLEKIRDTLYRVQVTDSLRDQSGKARFDSTGRAMLRTQMVNVPKQRILIDFNKDWKVQKIN